MPMRTDIGIPNNYETSTTLMNEQPWKATTNTSNEGNIQVKLSCRPKESFCCWINNFYSFLNFSFKTLIAFEWSHKHCFYCWPTTGVFMSERSHLLRLRHRKIAHHSQLVECKIARFPWPRPLLFQFPD